MAGPTWTQFLMCQAKGILALRTFERALTGWSAMSGLRMRSWLL